MAALGQGSMRHDDGGRARADGQGREGVLEFLAGHGAIRQQLADGRLDQWLAVLPGDEEPALIWPNSIMLANTAMPLSMPRQAFEMSKSVAMGEIFRRS